MVWVLSVLWEKGVVWGFARLEGVLPKIPILKKVHKVPGIRAGGLSVSLRSPARFSCPLCLGLTASTSPPHAGETRQVSFSEGRDVIILLRAYP